jgi:fucose 4-O-acetylase-like acetyltransferase
MTAFSTTDTPVSVAPRLEWVDTAKGLCIALVVYGHAFAGLRDAGAITADSPFGMAFYYIYSFHMAAFFVLSGLFIERRARAGAGRILKTMPENLIWPYVLWGSVIMVIQSLAGRYTNAQVTALAPHDFLALLNRPPSPFWYIYVLFFYQLTALFFVRLKATLWLLPLALLLSAVAAVVPVGKGFVLFQLPYFFFFFTAGVILGRRADCLGRPWPFDKLYVSGALFALILVPLLWAHSHNWSYYDWRLLPVAVLGIGAVLTFSRSPTMSMNPVLGYLGRRSLPIYVMHVIFTAGARIALVKVVGLNNPALTLGAIFLTGLVGPLIAYEIAVRLRITRLLGFGATGRATSSSRNVGQTLPQ